MPDPKGKLHSQHFRVDVTFVSLSGITTLMDRTSGPNKKLNHQRKNSDPTISIYKESADMSVRAYASLPSFPCHLVSKALPPPSLATKHVATWESGGGTSEISTSTTLAASVSSTTSIGVLLFQEDEHSLKEQSNIQGEGNGDIKSTGSHVTDETFHLSPKLVDINVGVSQHDENIHLGVSTFVVSGHEVKNQILDLPVQQKAVVENDASGPLSPNGEVDKSNHNGMNGHHSRNNSCSNHSDHNSIGGGTGTGPLQNNISPMSSTSYNSRTSPPKRGDRSKKLKSFFKFHKRNDSQQPLTFSHDPRTFGVAPNSILRIRVTVARASAESIRSMYQCSFRLLPLTPTKSLSVDKMTLEEQKPEDEETPESSRQVDIICNPSPKECIEVVNGGNEFSESLTKAMNQDFEDATVDTNFVISSVKVHHKSAQAFRTHKHPKHHHKGPNNLIESLAAGSFCGMMADLDSGSDYTEEQDQTILDDEDDDEGMTQANDMVMQKAMMDNEIPPNSDYDDENDQNDTYGDASVGDATIESLQNAKETLRRYATRVGVDVEDLLHSNPAGLSGDETFWDGSTIGTGTIDHTINTKALGDRDDQPSVDQTSTNDEDDDESSEDEDDEDDVEEEETVDHNEDMEDDSTIETTKSFQDGTIKSKETHVSHSRSIALSSRSGRGRYSVASAKKSVSSNQA